MMTSDNSCARDEAKQGLHKYQVAEIKNGLAEADRGEFAAASEFEQTIRRWKRPAGGGQSQ